MENDIIETKLTTTFAASLYLLGNFDMRAACSGLDKTVNEWIEECEIVVDKIDTFIWADDQYSYIVKSITYFEGV